MKVVRKVYMIFDSAVQAWDPPVVSLSRGAFLRDWDAICPDPKLKFGASPADYTAFEVGEFDDHTGLVKMYEAKENLGTALQAIARRRASEQEQGVQ